MDELKENLSQRQEDAILRKLRKDPRVKEVWSEGEDGWWLDLKPGWYNTSSETHTHHEWSLYDLQKSLKLSTEPCDSENSRCDSCYQDQLWKKNLSEKHGVPFELIEMQAKLLGCQPHQVYT